MYNEKYFDKVNGKKLLQKILNNIFNEYKGAIAIDGPSLSGKSSVVNETIERLIQEGFINVYFDFKNFVDNRDILSEFTGMLIFKLKSLLGKRFIKRFLKANHIKKIEYTKIASSKQKAITFTFRKKKKKHDKEFNYLLNTLLEIDQLIQTHNIRLLLTFDNLENLELYEIYDAYKLLEIISQNIKHIYTITTVDSNYLKTDLNIKDEFESMFPTIFEIKKEFDFYDHHNKFVKQFIAQEKIYDISLIKSIDIDLDLIEKWLKRTYDFHLIEDDKKYYEELCFIFWTLKYYKIQDFELIDTLNNSMEFIKDVKRNNKIYDIDSVSNLNLITLALKNAGFKFNQKNTFLELIQILELPTKSALPVLIYFSNDNKFSVVNELYIFYIFVANLTQIKSPYNQRENIAFLIDNNTLKPSVLSVLKVMNQRIVEEMSSSRIKEIYDIEFFEILKNFLELL
ncbi:P-loop NTPase family protein [Spiroplasma culicicola]|uniref:KAP NTPase domain-containing protein n=1 Tax=Spiroplasma culicicola AES-1 TaxID=1276246 RepID=W6A775_9MOLU|nr:ATP-binding protein [Spiroplasma culicicola]AHI52847.1 hypothetical protein SCULI_v1c05060 [Spiroplasma culicicola AES-1]